MKGTHFLPLILGLSLVACGPQDEVTPANANLTINFTQTVEGVPVELDQMIYKNALQQPFSIKTIKYFISGIKLYKADNTVIEFPDIHYVDIRTPETLKYILSKQIPQGDYTGIAFTYGLSPQENITGSLGLELDQLMEWPVPMGGGYHYAKIEGQYIAEDNYFNFHSGMLNGKDYAIYVKLLDQPFTVTDHSTIMLNMEMLHWFTNPFDWDFTYFGPAIMGNAEAQQVIHDNGIDVFSFTNKDSPE